MVCSLFDWWFALFRALGALNILATRGSKELGMLIVVACACGRRLDQ